MLPKRLQLWNSELLCQWRFADRLSAEALTWIQGSGSKSRRYDLAVARMGSDNGDVCMIMT